MTVSELFSSSSTRIKTALLLTALIFTVGLINNYSLIWFCLGILLMLSIYEVLSLFDMQDNMTYLYALFIWILAYFYPQPESLIFLIAVLYASVLAYNHKLNKKKFLPLLYPITSFLFLLALYKDFSIDALLWLLIIVASTDIGAYFVGKLIGNNPFCKTSPKKTWEGVVGGILFASCLGSFFAHEQLSFFIGFLISLIVSVSSIFGDLFESYLKREANVKDSGNILPGHGGILDRMDGYLFGSIVLLILLRTTL